MWQSERGEHGMHCRRWINFQYGHPKRLPIGRESGEGEDGIHYINITGSVGWRRGMWT